MEILEYPTIKCKCGCTFSYNKEDLKEQDIFQFITPSGYKIYKVESYINCPFCDKTYTVKYRTKIE